MNAATLTDLFGAAIIEERRLGYLPRDKMIAEIRKVFPNATVLRNRNEHKKT
jgi:hypothetical protein